MRLPYNIYNQLVNVAGSGNIIGGGNLGDFEAPFIDSLENGSFSRFDRNGRGMAIDEGSWSSVQNYTQDQYGNTYFLSTTSITAVNASGQRKGNTVNLGIGNFGSQGVSMDYNDVTDTIFIATNGSIRKFNINDFTTVGVTSPTQFSYSSQTPAQIKLNDVGEVLLMRSDFSNMYVEKIDDGGTVLWSYQDTLTNRNINRLVLVGEMNGFVYFTDTTTTFQSKVVKINATTGAFVNEVDSGLFIPENFRSAQLSPINDAIIVFAEEQTTLFNSIISYDGATLTQNWSYDLPLIDQLNNIHVDSEGNILFDEQTSDERTSLSVLNINGGKVGNGTTFPSNTLSAFKIFELDETIDFQDIVTYRYEANFNPPTTGVGSTRIWHLTRNGGEYLYRLTTANLLERYELLQAGQITSIRETAESTTLSEDSSMRDVFVSPDGTKLYAAGANTDTIYEYDMTTPFNLGTLTYNSVSLDISLDGLTNGILIKFNDNGTKLYVQNVLSTVDVHQYTLTVPWDLSSASYDFVSLQLATSSGERGFDFSQDGTKIYHIENSPREIRQYDLPTAWDVTGATLNNKYLDTNQLLSTGDRLYTLSENIFFTCRSGNDEFFKFLSGVN